MSNTKAGGPFVPARLLYSIMWLLVHSDALAAIFLLE